MLLQISRSRQISPSGSRVSNHERALDHPSQGVRISELVTVLRVVGRPSQRGRDRGAVTAMRAGMPASVFLGPVRTGTRVVVKTSCDVCGV